MPDSLEPPIFLLGNVRSGTSMIHDLFDEHPEVVGWFEPRTIWTYPAPLRRHDRFVAADATPGATRFIRRRFQMYQDAHGGRRIMEKTPSNVMRIPYVRAIFPESKFLYVIREPLAQLSSTELRGVRGLVPGRVIERIAETAWWQLPLYLPRYVRDHVRARLLGKRMTYYGVRYPGYYEDRRRFTFHQMIARQWVECSRQVEEDLAHLDEKDVLRFRYEDFVEAPTDFFPRILEFFGLSMTPGIEARLSNWVDRGRQEKWRRLDPGIIRSCLPILREEMARHGYGEPEGY